MCRTLENGTYGLVVGSTERLHSVVRTLETGAPESLIAYRGQSMGATTLRFGPVYKTHRFKLIHLLNTSARMHR